VLDLSNVEFFIEGYCKFTSLDVLVKAPLNNLQILTASTEIL
jgi:hypothetical protein